MFHVHTSAIALWYTLVTCSWSNWPIKSHPLTLCLHFTWRQRKITVLTQGFVRKELFGAKNIVLSSHKVKLSKQSEGALKLIITEFKIQPIDFIALYRFLRCYDLGSRKRRLEEVIILVNSFHSDDHFHCVHFYWQESFSSRGYPHPEKSCRKVK